MTKTEFKGMTDEQKLETINEYIRRVADRKREIKKQIGSLIRELRSEYKTGKVLQDSMEQVDIESLDDNEFTKLFNHLCEATPDPEDGLGSLSYGVGQL